MNDVARKRLSSRSILSILCLLFLVGVAIFAYTVGLRRPWFNTTGDRYTAGGLTSPLVSAKNWYREGFVHLRGVMYPNPDSIEFAARTAREPVVSYPPGMLLPIHIISKLTGSEPSIALIMGYNLANHFLIAMILALMVFVLLRQLPYDRRDCYLLCAIPIVLYLLLPGTLYDHQMRFPANHAVILYFALYVFIEVLRDGVTNKRSLAWLGFFQGVVAFMGIWTDWFFAFVAVCVYVKRLARGEMGTTLKSFLAKNLVFVFPVCMGLLVFGLQLLDVMGLERLLSNISRGITLPKWVLLNWLLLIGFWDRDMTACFGRTGILLLAVSLLCFVLVALYAGLRRAYSGGGRNPAGLRKEPNTQMNTALAAVFMLMGPCFLHLFVFYRRSVFPIDHSAVLKFAVPLATVPFILIPMIGASCFRRSRGIASIAPLLLFVLACGYVALEYPRIRPLFAVNINKEEEQWLKAFAEFVAENTTYEDIVFGSEIFIAIDTQSPYLPISMKCVYPIQSAPRILGQIGPLETDYVVCIVYRRGAQPKPGTFGEQLHQRAYEQKESPYLIMDKIRKQDFLEIVAKSGVPNARDKQGQVPEGPPILPEIARDPNLPADGAS